MVLEIKQHPVMWIVGFVTSLVYIFVFFMAKIYADMGLQIYYVLISVYGFWLWTKSKRNPPKETDVPSSYEIVYSHVRGSLLIGIIFAIVAVYGGIYYLLVTFTDSPVPMGDAFTTAVGIVATWMLAHRMIEHWYLWIVANTVSIYIYYLRDLYPTMFLYLCYTILAIVGLYTWIKKGTRINDKAL